MYRYRGQPLAPLPKAKKSTNYCLLNSLNNCAMLDIDLRGYSLFISELVYTALCVCGLSCKACRPLDIA